MARRQGQAAVDETRAIGPDEEPKLWRRYRRTRDAALRNRLARHYLPLAHRYAARHFGHLPDHLDPAEIRAAAEDGLLAAIERFDPGFGTRFSSYLLFRVRGAVLDSLRRMDLISRQQRNGHARFLKMAEELSHKLGRDPTDEEVLELGDGDTSLRSRLPIVMSLAPLMGPPAGGDRSSAPWRSGLESLLASRPIDTSEEEFFEWVTDGLCRRAQAVLYLYLIAGRTQLEIAGAFSLSMARVSQIIGESLAYIRRRHSRDEAVSHFCDKSRQ